MNDLNEPLDIFGQQPGLALYTQLCLCYAVSDQTSHSVIINTLTKGLETLTKSFPWVAGQVVNEGSSKHNSGIFKITNLEAIPRLVVKDLRDDSTIPSMHDVRRANCPMHILDESIIAPRTTLPEGSEPDSPVFLAQATFITGGLLLTFVSQHQAMDMTGQDYITHLLSKACRNEPFTSEELSTGNPDRQHMIPLLDDIVQESRSAQEEVEPVAPAPVPKDGPADKEAPPPAPCSWANITFSASSVTALKSLATKTITLPTGAYVSTDDTLSAFIWKCTQRARLGRLDPTTRTTFARAIDPRRYIGLPLKYPGLVQKMTYQTHTIQQLLDEPLGAIASQLRLAVDLKTSTIGHETRLFASQLARAADKSTVADVTSMLDLSTDIMLSSWGKVEAYNMDFGLGLGKPESVRRPRFTPVESLMYILPKAPNGAITVAVCLRDEDLERLKVDEGFMRYGRYDG